MNTTLSALVDDYTNREADLSEAEREQYKEQIAAIQSNIASYEAANAELDRLNAEVNKLAMQAAFYSSEVSTWDAIDVANKSLEEAIIKVVDAAERNGDLVGMVARDASGKITSGARDYAESILRSTQGYEKLFNKESNILSNLVKTENNKAKLESTLNVKYEDILKYIDTMGSDTSMERIEGFAKIMGKTTDSFISYVLNLNSMTSETENFARALGVSVDELQNYDELRRATLEDLNKSVGELTSEIDDLSSALNSIISSGGVSVSNLSNLIAKSPDLLMEYDSNGNIIGTDASSENIINNILNSVLGDGKYSTLISNSILNQIKDSSDMFALFKESLENSGIDTAFLSVYNTLSDGALDAIRASGLGDELNNFLARLSPNEYIEGY